MTLTHSIKPEKVPVIVKDVFSSGDLNRIRAIDFEKEGRECVNQLLNLIPWVGGTIAGELDVLNDIRDARFFRNFVAYIFELRDTLKVDRECFLAEIEKTAEDYSGNVLAGMIDRIDNINKGGVLANLTKAKMGGEITIEDFFRLSCVAERIPFSDFKYLPEFVNRNYLPDGVTELLQSAGALSQVVVTSEDNHDWFELSPVGSKLLKYGLLIDVRLKDMTKMEVSTLQWNSF